MKQQKSLGKRLRAAAGTGLLACAAAALLPVLKIRTGIPFGDCRLIAKYFLVSASRFQQFSYARRVLHLLFVRAAWRNFTPDYSLFRRDGKPEKKKWDIGRWYSIDPGTLQGTEARQDTPQLKLFSIGREAIAHILKTNRFEKKTALLPVFTCFTVLDPFLQDGWELHFYRYRRDLTVDDDSFLATWQKTKPSLCLFQPLSGMGFTQQEQRLIAYAHQNGSMTVVDQTQDIYNDRNHPQVDYYCGSLRKWYPFPDGGFLYSDKHPIVGCDGLQENHLYRTAMGVCMFARAFLPDDNDPFYDYLYRFMGEFSVSYIAGETIKTHTMSAYSRKILCQQDETANCEKRIRNFRIIYEGISHLTTVKPAFDTIGRLQAVPLSFPVYAKNRSRFIAYLRANGIRTQILWTKPPYIRRHVTADETTESVYRHILSLPCDQRYDENDMRKMVAVIQAYDLGAK